MAKIAYRDEIAAIILYELSIFNSLAEIKANPDHPHVRQAYRAADRIAAIKPARKLIDESGLGYEEAAIYPNHR